MAFQLVRLSGYWPRLRLSQEGSWRGLALVSFSAALLRLRFVGLGLRCLLSPGLVLALLLGLLPLPRLRFVGLALRGTGFSSLEGPRWAGDLELDRTVSWLFSRGLLSLSALGGSDLCLERLLEGLSADLFLFRGCVLPRLRLRGLGSFRGFSATADLSLGRLRREDLPRFVLAGLKTRQRLGSNVAFLFFFDRDLALLSLLGVGLRSGELCFAGLGEAEADE